MDGVRRLSAAKKLAFAALTTLLVLAAVEAVFHANGFGRQVVTVPDARVGFRLVPDQDRTMPNGEPVHVNAHGMRDEEFPLAKPAGEFRILLLGDSLTFGIDVGQEKTFPRLLHSALAEKRRIRVMNGAVQGYDSSQERDWLVNFGFALQPDLVVVMFFPNDIEFNERKMAVLEFPGRDLLRLTATFDAMEKTYFRREAERLGKSGTADSLRARQFQALLKRYTGQVAANPNDPAEKARTQIARGIFGEMAKLCRERKVELAVALIPAFANTRDPELPSILKGFAWDLEQEKVRSFSLLDALKGHHPTCWLAHDEGHLSEEGHRLVAAALERWLLESGHLPAPK